MPSPPNTRHQDADVAPLLQRLRELGLQVEEVDEARRVARETRRAAAAAAFAEGISWRRIAEFGRYGSAQAAQQDVTNRSRQRRRSGD